MEWKGSRSANTASVASSSSYSLRGAVIFRRPESLVLRCIKAYIHQLPSPVGRAAVVFDFQEMRYG
jgi:hypothetical protein